MSDTEATGLPPYPHASEALSELLAPIPLYISPLNPPCELVYWIVPPAMMSGNPSPFISIMATSVLELPFALLWVMPSAPPCTTVLLLDTTWLTAAAPVPCKYSPASPATSALLSKGFVRSTSCSVNRAVLASVAVR